MQSVKIHIAPIIFETVMKDIILYLLLLEIVSNLCTDNAAKVTMETSPKNERAYYDSVSLLIIVPYCSISLTGYCTISRESLPVSILFRNNKLQ